MMQETHYRLQLQDLQQKLKDKDKEIQSQQKTIHDIMDKYQLIQKEKQKLYGQIKEYKLENVQLKHQIVTLRRRLEEQSECGTSSCADSSFNNSTVFINGIGESRDGCLKIKQSNQTANQQSQIQNQLLSNKVQTLQATIKELQAKYTALNTQNQQLRSSIPPLQIGPNLSKNVVSEEIPNTNESSIDSRKTSSIMEEMYNKNVKITSQKHTQKQQQGQQIGTILQRFFLLTKEINVELANSQLKQDLGSLKLIIRNLLTAIIDQQIQ